jgi:hypothetical protein
MQEMTEVLKTGMLKIPHSDVVGMLYGIVKVYSGFR